MSGGCVFICQCVMQLDGIIGQTKFLLRDEKYINFIRFNSTAPALEEGVSCKTEPGFRIKDHFPMRVIYPTCPLNVPRSACRRSSVRCLIRFTP